MKKAKITFSLVVLLAALSACVYYNDTSGQNGQPTAQFESSIPLDLAQDLIAQVHHIWDADNGDLWGLALHAPIMIADPITRHAVANMPDDEGVLQPMGDIYLGILPDHVFIGHTATDFAGKTWAMMAWEPMIEQMLEEIPDFRNNMINLMIHEGFHAIQTQKVVYGEMPAGVDQTLPFLNVSADVRITVLMESKALATAVSSSGDQRLQAIHDALSIRVHRRDISPEAALTENAQEILEGLAMFTEILFFGSPEALAENYLQWVIDGAQSTALSFYPYFTGAMYAILLMEYSVMDWQRGITFETDLAALLQEALGIETTPFAQLDLERLGYPEIASIQHAWVSNYQRMLASAEDFLTQPHLLILGNNSLDSLSIASLEVFTIPNQYGFWDMVQYGNFTIVGGGWQLVIDGGHSSPSWFPQVGVFVRHYDNIEINQDASVATAPTWTLEVTNPAYTIQITDNNEIVLILR